MADSTDEESSDKAAMIQSENLSSEDTLSLDINTLKPAAENMEAHHRRKQKKNFQRISALISC